MSIKHKTNDPDKVERLYVCHSRGAGKQRIALTWHSDSETHAGKEHQEHLVATDTDRTALMGKAEENRCSHDEVSEHTW